MNTSNNLESKDQAKSEQPLFNSNPGTGGLLGNLFTKKIPKKSYQKSNIKQERRQLQNIRKDIEEMQLRIRDLDSMKSRLMSGTTVLDEKK